MLIVAMFRTINEKNDSYYSEKMSWQSLMKLKQRIMLVFTKIFLYTLSSFEYSDTPLKKIVIVYIKNIERISEFSSNIVESFQKYFFPYPNNVMSQDIIAFSPLPYQE